MFPFIRHTVHALVSILVIVAPVAVAFDRGGVLAWDVWLLSAIALVLVGATVLGHSSPPIDNYVRHLSGWRRTGAILLRWSPLLFFLCLSVYAVFQATNLPSGLVRWLSPASADAYTYWLAAATAIPPPSWLPISVDPYLSHGFAVFAWITVAFAFVGGVVFANRHFVVVLLVGLAIGGVAHGLGGFYQKQTTPRIHLFGQQEMGGPFGAFVNRNNAGAMLNLGLAGAVGLMALRVHEARRRSPPLGSPPGVRNVPVAPPGPATAGRAGSVHPLRQHPATASPLLATRSIELARALFLDRLFILAAVAAVVTLAAITASGSRGALVGAAAGSIASIAIAIPSRVAHRFAIGALAVFGIILASLDQLGLPADSLEQIRATHEDVSRGEEARFRHWPDALRATAAYLPAGAGMGAYRYAYLPFQRTGGGDWAVNADNQWLEWVLEGGIVAIVLMIAAIVAAVVALRLLFRSHDPIDQGLATAAVFGLPAIVISQTFDLALTLLPIAIVAALLASAVAARAGVGILVPSGTRRAVHPLRSVAGPTVHGRWGILADSRVLALLLPCVLVVVTALVVNAAHRRATSEALVVAARQFHQPGTELSLAKLTEMDEILRAQCRQDPENPLLLLERASIQIQLFRLTEAVRRATESPISLVRAYSQTDTDRLRAASAVESPPSDAAIYAANPHLRLARQLAHRALHASPLNDAARWILVRTDFAIADGQRTQTVLRQLVRLRSRTHASLSKAAHAAATVGDWQTAAMAWRQLLAVAPARLADVLRAVHQSGGAVQANDVIPEGRALVLAAVDLQLHRGDGPVDPELLARARRMLRLPISQHERELKRRIDETASSGAAPSE